MLRITFAFVAFSWWSASPAHAAPPIAFTAPPALRQALAAELTAQGRESVDLSELDQVLFGPEGAAALLAAGKPVVLPAALPAELKEDFARGLAGCRARPSQKPEARRACADHLVGAVWERHLARLRPERVLELEVMELLADGSVFAATYQPGEAVLSGIHWPDGKEGMKDLVYAALRGELPGQGGRQNTTELPTSVPLPPPDLRQGAPQRLAPLPMPEHSARCRLPARLSVSPASVPLAVTISTLWEVTVKDRALPRAAAPRCTLELNPRTLVFHCGGQLSEVELFPGTQLGDAALQATLARRFVQLKLHASCAAGAER